jgi:cytochrome c oxidase assembly protein subunit 15
MIALSFIHTSDRNDRAIGLWLLGVAGLVLAMILLGGVTRLTQSGLSMVDWKPLTGFIPPLSLEAWQAEFLAYKQYPEYKLINKGMALDEFKSIFWWEFSHRVLGRIIGLAFFIPMVLFWTRGRVRPRIKPKLVGLLILGGLQGLMGWYMVKSGLVHEPEVSHLRLTAHFMLAVVIIWALSWTALSLLRPYGVFRGREGRSIWHWSRVFFCLVLLQLALGALVAGLKAGRGYNTWPLMDGSFIPDGLFLVDPWWSNFLDNPLTVQFDHRMVAYLVFLVGVGLFIKLLSARAPARLKSAGMFLLFALVLQMGLGIYTLLEAVPLALGVLHQAGGMLVLLSAIVFAHECRRN